MNKAASLSTYLIAAMVFASNPQNLYCNNPIISGQGVCDPHIHIFNNKAFLFASHDEKPGNRTYTMNDWWVWSSPDLINWKKEFTLNPANTYVGTWNKCYATDGATRNGKYYFYFSKHSLNTGVAVSTTGPEGPYIDALGKQLTNGWDPTVFIDDDQNKTPYIIFGGYPYRITKLNEDMISFAEPVRYLTYEKSSSGSFASNSDGNFIHKRNGLYYLNQHAQKYGTSTNIYGPYKYRGKYFPSWNDHGTFFTWNNQDYLAYGLDDLDDFHRGTNITYAYYKENGDITGDVEVAKSSLGVGQYDPKKTIQAEWYFAASDGTSKNENTGGFEVRGLANNSYLYFPNIKNCAANTVVSFRVSSANPTGGTIEVHEERTDGPLLGACTIPSTGSWTTYQTITCKLANNSGDKSLYLVVKGTGTEILRLDYFSAISGPSDAITSRTAILNQTQYIGNYPNPFSSQTTICYQLGEANFVRLSIYSILGEKMTTIVNAHQSMGKYSVEWNGKDSKGNKLTKGLYLPVLETGNSILRTMNPIVIR